MKLAHLSALSANLILGVVSGIRLSATNPWKPDGPGRVDYYSISIMVPTRATPAIKDPAPHLKVSLLEVVLPL